jgi:HD-GYP domain-containing protein (c-di-GMP phosphodiesterase class II)
MADVTVRLAKALGIFEETLYHVRRGVLLHDAGTIMVPDSILLKPGPLTSDEQEIMRRHPLNAFELLSGVENLRQALDIPTYHHEKWDGTGYPQQWQGEQIPFAARIFAVVDVWHALTSDRPYRPAWKLDAALAYLREQSGRHYDPRVVEMFLRMLDTGST